MRLLVIDESAERRELLRAGLRLAGYEVAAMLGSPAALLETIAEQEPDAIVIDAGTMKALVSRLADANRRLEERMLVERAKGLLMKARGLDEESAYRALRRMAMDQNRRIGEVARSVIGMAHLLG
jgi:response regulator NasT